MLRGGRRGDGVTNLVAKAGDKSCPVTVPRTIAAEQFVNDKERVRLQHVSDAEVEAHALSGSFDRPGMCLLYAPLNRNKA